MSLTVSLTGVFSLVPYVTKTRQKLELAMDHPALALFDVFKAHRCDTVLEKVRQNHIHQVAGCTGELQPLSIYEVACWYEHYSSEDLKGVESWSMSLRTISSLFKDILMYYLPTTSSICHTL